MEQIRSMFGSNVPDPVAFTRSQWGTDPYAKGCYSSAKVGEYMQHMRIYIFGHVYNYFYYFPQGNSWTKN